MAMEGWKAERLAADWARVRAAGTGWASRAALLGVAWGKARVVEARAMAGRWVDMVAVVRRAMAAATAVAGAEVALVAQRGRAEGLADCVAAARWGGGLVGEGRAARWVAAGRRVAAAVSLAVEEAAGRKVDNWGAAADLLAAEATPAAGAARVVAAMAAGVG